MTRKRLFLIITITGFLIAGIVFLYVFRPASKNVGSKKADVEISAQELVRQFETNETEANALYNDKVILVSGTIENVSEEATVLTVSIKNPDAMSGVLCSFDKSSALKEDFAVGSEIRIKGICTGYLMDVVLIKCSLVK
jgi:hypothetical protein